MTVRGIGPIATAQKVARVDAGGTVWRLRSLIAMGHDCVRIALALQVSPAVIRHLVHAETATVSPSVHGLVRQLWDAWWDKTPPQRTSQQRRACAQALQMAERHNWPAAAGLDEDLLDEPGYRPWSRYRSASGTGQAADFRPMPLGATTLHPPLSVRRHAS